MSPEFEAAKADIQKHTAELAAAFADKNRDEPPAAALAALFEHAITATVRASFAIEEILKELRTSAPDGK